MNKVIESTLPSTNSLIRYCYLTKNEVILIFSLSIISCYAIKMEMLLAENKPLSSPEAFIENAVIPHGNVNVNVQQSTMMHKKGIHQTPDNLSYKVELAQVSFMERNYAKANILTEQVLTEKDWTSVLSLESL